MQTGAPIAKNEQSFGPRWSFALCFLAGLELAAAACADESSLPRMVLEPVFTAAYPPPARSIAVSPAAPLLAIATERQVLLYHTQSLELLGVLAFPEGQADFVGFTRDGRRLIAGTGNSQPSVSSKVVVWDLSTGEREVNGGTVPDAVFAAQAGVAVCQRTWRIFAASASGAVYVYRVIDAAPLGILATNPTPLAERLAAAQQRLQQSTAASAPLIDALQKAQAALMPAQAALAAAQQEAANSKAESEKVAVEIQQLNQSRSAQDAERTKLSQTVTQLQAARPLVAESLRHLTEAIGKQPDDAKLAEVHRQLTEQLAGMEKRVADMQTKTVELTAAVADADAKLKGLTERGDAVAKQTATVAEHIVGIQAELAKLTAAAEAGQNAAKPAQAALAAAQHEVERWQNEIAFRDEMAALNNELTTVNQLAATRRAELEKANAQLTAAQSAAAAAKTQFDEASRGIESIRAKIQTARARK